MGWVVQKETPLDSVEYKNNVFLFLYSECFSLFKDLGYIGIREILWSRFNADRIDLSTASLASSIASWYRPAVNGSGSDIHVLSLR